MASVDFGRYKRLVQAFWDPEPRNDDPSGSCIWCLGKEYMSQPLYGGTHDRLPVKDQGKPPSSNGLKPHFDADQAKPEVNGNEEHEPQVSESEVDGGWPAEFLDDCEARVWFTYRSNFPPIKRSSDASMTLSVRLRSLGDQGGFTSDTGWGCMIRSGQSLLANALVTLRLGRGMSTPLKCNVGSNR